MAFNNSPTDEWDDWGATENVVPQNSNTVDSEENWDNFDNNNQDGFNDLNTQGNDWGSSNKGFENPNNDWNNQNNGFDGSNNGWDNFDKEVNNQNTQNNGWEDWGNQQPQDNSQSGSFINQQDGWDDFGSNQDQSGNFVSQQNNWDNQNWNNQQSQNNNWDNQQPQNNNWNGMQNNQSNQIPIKTPVNFNFSSKKIAFILAGIFIVLAVLFMCIDKVHINKKPKAEQEQTTEVVEQSNENKNNDRDQDESQSQNKQQVNTSSNSAVLVQIPEDTVLNYSGDVLEANGAVTSKTKFVQGHQVLYCVTINLTFGASSENINYYCNYASYNAVSVGDIVVVSYQQVDDNYISVNAISK